MSSIMPGRVVELLDTHGLRQPSGRIDREHDDVAAAFGSPQRHGRGGGRLAHPARSAAHDDVAAAVVQQGVDIEHECRVVVGDQRPDAGAGVGAVGVGGHASPCSVSASASS
jgi:hypothetical protein